MFIWLALYAHGSIQKRCFKKKKRSEFDNLAVLNEICLTICTASPREGNTT